MDKQTVQDIKALASQNMGMEMNSEPIEAYIKSENKELKVNNETTIGSLTSTNTIHIYLVQKAYETICSLM